MSSLAVSTVQLMGQHLQMLLVSLGLSIVLAWTIVALILTYPPLRSVILLALSTIYTIPNLALIAFLIPIMGINAKAILAVVVIYNQIILVRNVLVGFETIPLDIQETALALGMNFWQRWWRVQIPLILPIFLAGIRLASIISLATLTLGAKVNGGGLGKLLFEGIQTQRYDKIWFGTIALAVLGITINYGLQQLEKFLDDRVGVPSLSVKD